MENITKPQKMAIENGLSINNLEWKKTYTEIFPGEQYYKIEDLPYKKAIWIIQILNKLSHKR